MKLPGPALAAALTCALTFNNAAAAGLKLPKLDLPPAVKTSLHLNPYPGYHVTPAMKGRDENEFPARAATYDFSNQRQPLDGYTAWCKANTPDCAKDQTLMPAQRILLSDENWRAINRINVQVNTTVKYVGDLQKYGVTEKWTLPQDNEGDCEDYVMLKSKLLREAGFHPSAILMLTVFNGNAWRSALEATDGGHALLLVRTSGGDFVLDNYHNRVLPLQAMRYAINRIQVPLDRSKWADGSIKAPDLDVLFEGMPKTTMGIANAAAIGKTAQMTPGKSL